MPLQVAKTVNKVWSNDFVFDSLSTDRTIERLTVADDLSHGYVDIAMDYGIALADRDPLEPRCIRLGVPTSPPSMPKTHETPPVKKGADPAQKMSLQVVIKDIGRMVVRVQRIGKPITSAAAGDSPEHSQS